MFKKNVFYQVLEPGTACNVRMNFMSLKLTIRFALCKYAMLNRHYNDFPSFFISFTERFVEWTEQRMIKNESLMSVFFIYTEGEAKILSLICSTLKLIQDQNLINCIYHIDVSYRHSSLYLSYNQQTKQISIKWKNIPKRRKIPLQYSPLPI